ncbi:MAG TPA: hypothetical protein H9867_05815 [Candidatus Corynebacterium gallistercoris]|uniref:Uncharacterized protein n=1 Tax=Candidatus Corynebacterium gallistercoris TaxID=2838530 RepID=A0A9D1RYA0_9CORY|nr:hypothetical protein [Candidatus Corynebacterium gallistercoris]
MIDQVVDLGGNIIDIVFNAITGNWASLAKAVVNTVGSLTDLGSSAIDSSSEADAGQAGDAAEGAGSSFGDIFGSSSAAEGTETVTEGADAAAAE